MSKKEIKNHQKRVEMECLKCKAQFDIWLSNAKFAPEVEQEIRRNFPEHCPACKEFEESSW